jgi:hypothetical protein
MTKTQHRSSGQSKQSASTQPAAGRPTTNRKFADRQAAKQRATLEATRRRNRKLGIGSVVLVLAIIGGLIVVKAAGSGDLSPGSSAGSVTSPAKGTAIPPALTSRLTSVPLSTLAAAPTSGVVASPQPISDGGLTVAGKPDLLYVGAEFCPVCATERWAMYVALSKFGTFSPAPGAIHSAVRDGDISTLTFYGTTYTSPYFAFTPVETTTNQPNGNYYVALQNLSPAQQSLWQLHTNQSFPWVDFGGKMELTSAQYDPAILQGLSFKEIAKDVGNNSTQVGAAIDASASVLVRTICSTLTHNQPAVCAAVGK